MEISKLHELYVVCGSFLCGAVLGFIFDIFRSMRKCFVFKDKTVALQDLIYWIIALSVIYAVVYYLNFAQLRMYQFLFMLAGVYIYIKALSRHMQKLMCRIIIACVKSAKIVYKAICVPFKVLLKVANRCVFSPARRLFSGLYTKLTKTTHKIKGLTSKFCKRFQKS